MTYHTVLVNLPTEEGVDAALDVATTVAEHHAAHLTGLHIVPPIEMPYAYYGTAIPLAVTEALETRQKALTERLHERFEKAVSGLTPVSEWRALDAVGDTPERVLFEQANTADLVVTGLPEEVVRRGSRAEPGARLLAGTGRPVMLVPPERAAGTLGERVFIAWDGQRAATRALFSALPILATAKAVRVQRINAPHADRHHALGTTEALAETLSRHGVDVEVFHADARAGEVGDELLGFARDWSADLLVAGCLERSGVREFLFGSTTRHLLEQSAVPMLMSS